MINLKVLYQTNQPREMCWRDSETEQFRRVSVSCIKKVFVDDKQIPRSRLNNYIPKIIVETFCRNIEKLLLKEKHSVFKQDIVYTKAQLVESCNKNNSWLSNAFVDYEISENGQFIAIELHLEKESEE